MLPDLRFPTFFGFSGALKASIVVIFWNNFRRFLGCFWHLGSCMPKEVSRYPHDCCRMAYLSLSGPTWTQVGSKFAQVGPMLAPSWLQLGSSWPHVGTRSRSPAAPEPTQTLPDPFPSPSRPYERGYSPSTRPGQQDLEPGRCLLDPPRPPTWTPNLLHMPPKRSFPGSKSTTQARWLGIASL